MKEFPLNLKPALMAGLRKEVGARNSMALTQSTALHNRNGVLVPANELVNPFSPVPTISWPFPQLIQGNGIMILAYDTEIKEVGSAWDEIDITLYDMHNSALTKAITSSTEPWHFVDFHNTWFLVRPNCVIARTNAEGMFGEDVKTYAQDNVSINTGCAFRGRCLFGGFNPDDFWSDDWRSLLEDWTDRLAYQVDTTLSMASNFVWWSAIGGGNVLDLFKAERNVDGTFKEEERTIEEPTYLEYFRRNDTGFMPMPFRGSVLVTKQLGKAVVVYGEDGIAVMHSVVDPAPTFGCEKISNSGVLNRGAVGGDDFQHVFISSEGDLCTVGTDFNVKRLGYKEFFSGFGITAISYDEMYKEFHIAEHDHSYVLSPAGLGEGHLYMTSAFRYQGSFVGIAEESESTEAIIVTDTIDLGIRDLKTLTTIELGITTTADVYVALDYRYAKNESFVRSTWKKVNKEGFMRFQITALEFRVCVKCSDFSDIEFDYMTVKWQLDAKRTVRGIYGNSSDT